MEPTAVINTNVQCKAMSMGVGSTWRNFDPSKSESSSSVFNTIFKRSVLIMAASS